MKLDPQLINATQKMLHEGAINLMVAHVMSGSAVHMSAEACARLSFDAYAEATDLLQNRIARDSAQQQQR